jgi:hypothetical protein
MYGPRKASSWYTAGSTAGPKGCALRCSAVNTSSCTATVVTTQDCVDITCTATVSRRCMDQVGDPQAAACCEVAAAAATWMGKSRPVPGHGMRCRDPFLPRRTRHKASHKWHLRSPPEAHGPYFLLTHISRSTPTLLSLSLSRAELGRSANRSSTFPDDGPWGYSLLWTGCSSCFTCAPSAAATFLSEAVRTPTTFWDRTKNGSSNSHSQEPAGVVSKLA